MIRLEVNMAVEGAMAKIIVCLLFILHINIAIGQILTPQYFNLAYQSKITSTATCGEGVSFEERYCKLTGSDPHNYEGYGEVIQGQLCDLCVSNEMAELFSRERPKPEDPDYWGWRVHQPESAVDGSEKWWQSPPLSRGLQYNEVNVSIALGQEFHVAYVYIKMANSPRPGVFALDRSVDNGATWKPWQYFADTISDCYHFFGEEQQFTTSIVADDSVICTTEYSSVVPLENGEIAISLVNGRPGAQNFTYSPILREWTKATNVRLRLLRTKTLLGHLMAVNVDQDPTVTRRYFYSIKDISIGGRCVCNGHADACSKYAERGNERKLICNCRHNTCGDQCETCCPGFVQKPWQPANIENTNECEPCQCYGHSNECYYDEEVARNRQSVDIHGKFDGGGVCQNCRHNTEGINCERCRSGFFRPDGMPLDSPDVCQPCNCDQIFSTGDCEDGTGRCICRPEYTGPNCERCSDGFYGWPECRPCDCNINGTLNGVCAIGGGQCPCKPQYDGQFCDRCAYGHYDFPYCRRCNCDGIGALDSSCDDVSGECRCKNNHAGRDCATCANGFYNYPACNLCQCDLNGCTDEVCDVDTGTCLCKENFAGARCDRCALGYYRYPFCEPCNCQSPGSENDFCAENGQCQCNYNFAGISCDNCAPGFYNYPNCLSCNCDSYGSWGQTCHQQTGQCDCRHTFAGLTCGECRPNYYNYPNCEECNCNPAGAMDIPGLPLGGCGTVNKGILCECKDRVKGHICDTCKPGYFNLNINNPLGCEDCGCFRPGTTGNQNSCDGDNGQCVCKTFTQARRCDQCIDGMYNLRDYNHFGCQDCTCDVGGSLDNTCVKSTGQCNCRPRVLGRACDEPIPTHYFPTLYHHQYEMEDGRTARGGAVRYGVDEQRFPGYSWRGYAILSRLQEEVLIDVVVTRTTLFRIVYSFENTEFNTITGQVKVTSDQPGSVAQNAKVYFPVTGVQPSLVSADTTVYLPAGRWTFSLKSPQTLFVDYMVLLPREYYEASVLQQPINSVCRLPMTEEPCKHYVYVNVTDHPVVRGEQGTVRRGSNQERTQLFPDRGVTDQLGTGRMAYLDTTQPEVSFSLPVITPGKYYLVMLYHSTVDGRTQDLKVDLVSDRTRDSGQMHLASCPYTSLCRQVVVDDNGDAKPFDFKGNYASISFTGADDIDLAVDSVIAIPADQWNLELIQPRLKCVMQDRKCVESNFQLPTGSVRVEVEAGRNQGIIATDLPPNIMDTTVKVVKVNGAQPTVNVQASVDRQGPHVFVVHYYQPFDIGFDINVDVLVGLQTNKGKFRADYCPGVSGCRAAVSFDENSLNGHTVVLGEMDFVLAFNNSRGKPVWLDNIIVIPSPQFSPSVLDVRPVDKSAEFINNCGSNNFYIDTSTQGFCRDGVFSLTTDYNNGALSCNCNSEGSTGFSCMQFGGQCRCRADVIGRDCSRCRNGYFGFPECRPCNCKSGLCDDRTGQCTCPPRVTGDNCDICLPRTFGFDPLIGCEECNCDYQGVLQGNQECDVNTGQCSCRDNVLGRRCDECRFGFYAFPQCQRCSCSPEGTEERICDSQNGRCVCKENVEGPTCGRCVPGTYNLDPRNVRGCSQCYCFGETSLCQSSNLRRKDVMDMAGWAITNLRVPEVDNFGSTVSVDIEQGNVYDPNLLHYWVAPLSYLGNKVTAYGGLLTFTVSFEEAFQGISRSVVEADLRIEGNNMSLTHIALSSPIPGEDTNMEVQLIENNFVHERTGNQVTRQQFMMVLARMDSLQIRASYYDTIREASLSEVVMEVATEDGRGEVAQHVEQCVCPPSYTGTSCENCARGYFRSSDGPFKGKCIPCRCNGRSDVCDPETGICSQCRDSFMGPQCLKCMEGHYEDPYTGRCEPCACPGTFDNNFAHTCEVTPSGIVARCVCKRGYAEPDCGICENGYWGNPQAPGGKCELCACSGNIDIRDRLSCDMITGACLRCINNSTGHRCERCREWFWGDAVNAKDCKMCTCNQVGSELCDHDTGTCLCKPNVVGPDCDRCARGTYGFNSGIGCQRCDCAEGAFSGQCDLETGQCSCRPGVTGRRCDQCDRGYWGYSQQGCRKCDCESDGAVTCDPGTGICQCLPGVTGPKCDSCLPRWALVPDLGCKECDQCVTLLLDDIEGMYFDTDDMIDDLTSISVGVTAIRRLRKINDTVAELRPKVDGIISNSMDTSLLDPIKEELMRVQQLAKTVRDKGQHTERSSDVAQMDADDANTRAQDLQNAVIMAVDAANEAVKYAEDILQDILSNIKSSNVEQMLLEMEAMLKEIQARDFTDRETAALEELQKAKDALIRALGVHRTAQEQANRTMSLGRDVEDISDKLKDLLNNSKHSLDNSKAAIDINANTNSTMLELQRMLKEIKEAAQDAQMMEDVANELLADAREFLLDAADAFVQVELESSRLDAAMGRLEGFVEQRKRENEDLSPVVERALAHADSLQKEAERLDSLLADTRDSAEGALNASRAYQAIVDAIEKAMQAAEDAIKAAEEAKDMSNGLADRALKSRDTSEILKDDSQKVKQEVQSTLRPRLDQAIIETDRIDELNGDTRDGLDKLNAGLDMLPEGGYGKEAQEAADKAMEAEAKAQEARDKIKGIKEQLPDDLERVREIPQMIDGVNRDVMRAQADVDNVINLVPQIDDLITKLDVERERITQIGEDLSKEIAQLRENIKLSRGEASRITVGVKFDQDVALQVRNPSNLDQAGGYGQISMYFRTEADNGFLAYVGPDAQSRQKFDDYMALEVADGKVLFTFDLGDGPTKITSNQVVSDGAWHQVVAERMGKTGTLTVRTNEEPDDIQTGSSGGTMAVFDINPDAIMFFVGGVPSKAELNGRVNALRFDGCIEEVKFDGMPIGLWDFLDGENNNQGCATRDVLTTVTSNEFRFEGDGYVILDKDRFRPGTTCLVNLEFRTYEDDGLLFLMGEEVGFKDFFSIELIDGRVLFQFDLGSGVGEIISDEGKKYSDGNWHKITANRKRKAGLLKIDGETVGSASSRGTQMQLNIGNNLYIGGYKGTHAWPGVTNKAFEGCIRYLELSSTNRDLNDNKFALNMIPGCQTISRIISFGGEVGNSFIAMDPVNVNSDFEMTMKVKGSEGDGVLFYVSDDSNDHALSVVLKEGRFVMTVAPGEGVREVITSKKDVYSDGRWHYVTVTKTGRDLQLNIDDIESLSTKYQGGKKKMVTTTALYFGGIPPGIIFNEDNLAGIDSSFIGCVGDVTVNGNFINFAIAAPTNMRGVSLSSCPVPDPVPEVTPSPTFPTFPEPQPTDQENLQCVLPKVPAVISGGESSGTRFGDQPDSRLEYDAVPDLIGDQSRFSLEFKTDSESGVLFYVAGDQHQDFLGVFMRDGLIHYNFNCGTGPARMVSPNSFNDGLWHAVEFSRDRRAGSLQIDGIEEDSGTAEGSASSINVMDPFFVGGIPPKITELASTNLQGVTEGFIGCIRNLQLNDQALDEPSNEVSVSPCSGSFETGTFFADRGNVQLLDNFVVGLDKEISLEVRARTLSGVLVSVYSETNGEYLVIQLVNGDIVFNVYNGRGDEGEGEELKTRFVPSPRNSICDGTWHTINAKKNKNVVRVQVDGVFTGVGVGVEGVSDTNTNDPLYIGGVPVRHPGIRTSEHFVGCIRNVKIDGKAQNLSAGKPEGSVALNACPVN